MLNETTTTDITNVKDVKTISLSSIEPVRLECKNRLDYNVWMYCEGCPKPKWRGKSHGLMCPAIPVAWYFITNECHSLKDQAIYSVYMFFVLFSYLASYVYHVQSDKYGPEVENLAIKLDRAAILWHVAGNFTPVALLYLKDTGIYLFTVQWLLSAIGTYRIFWLDRSIWWEPIFVGAIAILFIPEMLIVMTPFEFWMMIGSFVTSIIGGFVTAYKCEILTISNVFGYHEIFHMSVIVSDMIVYSINFSLASRNLGSLN
jgi:hypothetical protein